MREGVKDTDLGYWKTDTKMSPHIGHKNHLCEIAEEGRVALSDVKEMVRNPKFICRKCGRVAANEENLCEPVKL